MQIHWSNINLSFAKGSYKPFRNTELKLYQMAVPYAALEEPCGPWQCSNLVELSPLIKLA